MTSPTYDLLGSRWTRAWARAYTRGIDPDVAAERRDELAADVHDHLTDALDTGHSAAAASSAVLTRMLLGVPADLSWRSEQVRAHHSARRKEIAMSNSTPLRTLTLVLGGLVVAFGLTMTTGAAIAEGVDALWWGFAAVTALAVIGLALVVQRRSIGAGLLALATLGMCLAFYWFVALWVVGVLLIGFFVVAMLRERGDVPEHSPAARPTP